MNDWSYLLRLFHLRQGYHPATSPTVPPGEVKLLRLRLMIEELGELACALHQDELINVADGLVDLLYVVVGTAVEYGMGDILDEMFREVHRSNMTKDFINDVGGKKGGLKGLNYSPPDLATIIVREQTKK